MLEINIRPNGAALVLDLSGKLLADHDHRLWSAVQNLVVDQGARQLLLNFTEVTVCDSFGIGELLRLHNSLENIGGRIILYSVNDLIGKVFDITRVGEILRIAPDEATAMEFLSPLALVDQGV